MDIVSRLPTVRGEYRFDASLAKFCWFQIGGNANVLYKPADIEDLSSFIQKLPKEIPYFVFGVGSNLLISDSGYDGVAIRLGRNFNYANFDGQRVTSGAATLDLNLALASADNNLGGLEFLSGIPGTIGGALAMNAGAYGKETKDVLISAKVVSPSGAVLELPVEEIQYKYRGKGLGKDYIFVEGTFQGCEDTSDIIHKRITNIQEQRASSQPIRSRTGGSTFKNPDGHKAWELIDKAGCRGLIIGGAQVSEMHCNFFINIGTASANDMISLIKTVKDRVFLNSGILLEEEIKIIGCID